jgi:OmpA-OmpF porin, OOP family
MRKAMVIGVLALAGSLASPAFAKDEYSGVRLGIALGQETMDTDTTYLAFGTEKVSTDRLGYTVFGGWALNKWLAFEAAYNSGGQFNKTVFVDADNFPARDVASHYSVKSFIGSAVGSWWITPKFSLFGRVGVYGWKGKNSFKYDDDIGTNPPGYSKQHFDDDGFNPIFGAGVQTELDGALVRLEYTMTEFDDHVEAFAAQRNTSINSLTVSLVWTLR